MKVCVIGTGYVGLVVGACLADLGHEVTCVDVDMKKIEELNQGGMPIYEPDLDRRIIRNCAEGRLRFTSNVIPSLQENEYIFITVGTPKGTDDSVDLSSIYRVARELGKQINAYKVIVIKSTVPPGTAERVKRIIRAELDGRGLPEQEFDVVANPEFLREGSAIQDFMNPDRIIVGVDHERAKDQMEKIYDPFLRSGVPVRFMDHASAELTKYATNAMLATRISFMNELAALCDACGADIERIREGLGLDLRIGPDFLQAGLGYGGSCFPKDLRGLIHFAQRLDLRLGILEAVEAANRKQRKHFLQMIDRYFGREMNARKFAVWGLSFKPDTDDVRESPAIDLIQALRRRGAEIQAHDPVAVEAARKILGTRGITYFNDPYQCLENADALLLVTHWTQYRDADLNWVKSKLKEPVLFDGRNQFDPRELSENGFQYFCIGRNRAYAKP